MLIKMDNKKAGFFRKGQHSDFDARNRAAARFRCENGWKRQNGCASSAGKEILWGEGGVITPPILERGHKPPTTARHGPKRSGTA